jgi:RNase P subunit RPR2
MNPHHIGHRTVVALTCSKCGELKPGTSFDRYRRRVTDRIEYLTRRCRVCRWQHMATSLGR